MRNAGLRMCVAVAAWSIACSGMTRTSSTPQPPPAVGTSGTASPERVPASAARGVVPVGQELDVRLQKSLSSDTAKVEDRFEATTGVDVRQGDDVLIPAGSLVRGVVTSVQSAGRVERKGSLTLSFDRITVNGREYPIRATATQVFESQGIQGETDKIAAGAGVGAIVGGIIGGLKGALAGILIGAGGTVAATEGKDVELPAGTIIHIRFDSPVNVRRAT
jgi:hypothetical protein